MNKPKAIRYMAKAKRRRYFVRYGKVRIGSAETFEEAYAMLLDYAAAQWGSVEVAERYINKYFALDKK